MKTLSLFCLLTLFAKVAWSQEAMSAREFAKLVATPGDTKALRPEIALLPHFKNAKGTAVFKYSDGSVIEDKCTQTAKTIGGKFIVYSITSDSQKEPAYAIAGYDDNASAVRKWSLFKNALVEGTVVVDSSRKIFASSATFGGDLMQLTVGCFSDKEEFERSIIYRAGLLFMTVEVKTCPITTAEEVEQPGSAQPATQPADKPPLKDQPPTPTSKDAPR